MKKHILLIIIIVASLATHFLFFGQPRETVFDEVHFGKFISGYFTHEYFFDIHPPLGKLIISGMGYAADFEPGFNFAEIGQKFPDNAYMWLRLLPTIAGTLLPIVIYFLILELGMSRLAAFAGGMLVILENALLVQSRIILLDSFLLLFGFLAFLFYLLHRHIARHRMSCNWVYLLLSGIFGALAVSVKWTGATFLAIIVILYFIDLLKSQQKLKVMVRDLGFLVILPLIIYFSVFALHFSLLSKSGPGDAFMSPEFRKTLVGSADSANADLRPLNVFQKFNELNLQMYKSNATLTAGHPYSSKWYTWPFMIRPIYYWNDSASEQQSRIYFLGNPVIWWISTAAIFYLLLNAAYSIFRLAILKVLKKFHDFSNYKIKTLSVLLVGVYLFNLLPFISIKRAMFLYHYMVGLIFAIITLVYLIDQTKNKKRIFMILLAASFAAFIFFAPLSYGLPLTERAYNFRVWLPTWL
ncbi:MAG: phospholipid carrier-dependent glycosyltransferase [Candidatus Yanofskybacteria bacterium]|nr:phospholipid carrier-dependent glycosyltransferase [Candidatus Yanofskybacteria bacterium]